jgi:hypothetical protein
MENMEYPDGGHGEAIGRHSNRNRLQLSMFRMMVPPHYFGTKPLNDNYSYFSD